MPKEVFNSLYCRYFLEAFAGTRMPTGMGDAIFRLCKGVGLELGIIYGNWSAVEIGEGIFGALSWTEKWGWKLNYT